MDGVPAEARADPRTSAPLRLARAARIFVHLLEGLATTTFVFPFAARERRAALTRHWSERLLRIARIEVRAQGRVPHAGQSGLLVLNHVSWLDFVVVDALCPARFVAKSEIRHWPLAGRLVRGAGTLFIDRERRRHAHGMTRHMAAALASGDLVAVFPEGTTSDGSGVLPFKSSLLQAAVDAGAAVLPLALRYRDTAGERCVVAAFTGDETFLRSFWRVCGARGIVVEVRALAPLDSQGRHRRELARAAEDAIRSALA